MRKVVVIVCVLTFPVSLFARPSQTHARPLDPEYSSALAAANRFLHAWETQDHETAIMMLSDVARQESSPQLLQAFFSPQTQTAYEISRGRKTGGGQYSFPV